MIRNMCMRPSVIFCVWNKPTNVSLNDRVLMKHPTAHTLLAGAYHPLTKEPCMIRITITKSVVWNLICLLAKRQSHIQFATFAEAQLIWIWPILSVGPRFLSSIKLHIGSIDEGQHSNRNKGLNIAYWPTYLACVFYLQSVLLKCFGANCWLWRRRCQWYLCCHWKASVNVTSQNVPQKYEFAIKTGETVVRKW